MGILKKIVMLMLLLPLSVALYGQGSCQTEVRTYDVTCHGGNDGRAEIWKNGQLIELKSKVVAGRCAPAELPVRLCDNIPSGAISSSQTSGELKIRDEIVYLTSDFNGSIMFEGGGSLIICGNANVSTLNINEQNKPIDIQINGSMEVGTNNLNLNANVRMTNYGRLEVNGAGFNGAFFNHGYFRSYGDFSINSVAGIMVNTNTIQFDNSFNINPSSVFTNNGKVTISVDLKVNSSGSLRNNCSITVGKEFHINALSENMGQIIVSEETVSNAGHYKGDAGSLLKTKDLTLNSVMEGVGTTCAAVKVTGKTRFNEHGHFTGRIDLCLGSGEYVQNNAQPFVNGATFDCSCIPSPLDGDQGGNDLTGTINWGGGSPVLYGSTATGLPAGSYTVTVELEGCSPELHSFTIEGPPVFTASVSRDGNMATVSASGGNEGSYKYHWSDGYISSDPVRNLSSLPAGTYCVTVQDSENCEINAGCVLLYNQESCQTEVRTYDVTCHGGNDGRAEIWKNGQLIELHPKVLTGGCVPAETPVRLCDNIPTGAVVSNQTSGTLTIKNETVYLKSSDFNGSIMFEEGGTLIICGNAKVNTLNINSQNKPIDIQINGSMEALMSNLNLGPDVRVTNYGRLEVQEAGFNGEFFNHGYFKSFSDFSINSIAGSMVNTDTMQFNQSFNISNSSVFTNNGKVNISIDLKVNSSGSLRNNCNMTVGQKFHINALSENMGRILVSDETVSNSGHYKGGAGSILQTRDLMLNSVMEGIGATCASVKVTRTTTFNGSGLFTGRIDLCPGSGFNTQDNSNAFVNGATFDCSCSPGSLEGDQNDGDLTGTINWSGGSTILYGSTATGLRANSYTVTVKLEGCNPEEHIFTITEPPVFTASVNRVGDLATVTASGGNEADYKYIWSDGYTSFDPVRNLGTLSASTYCVSVQDSKKCEINAGCVTHGTVVVNDSCHIHVDYQLDQILVESLNCPCAWRVLTEDEPVTGVTQALFPIPCKDSVVVLVNCMGERTEHKLEGNKNGCTPTVCPNPSNPECMPCPGTLNPVCCPNPPCCIVGLDPDCEPGSNDLSVVAIETPASCGGGGSVQLNITGGSGQYRTSNPHNIQDGLYITGLPVGSIVITIYDVTKPEDKLYKTVVIPEPPVFSALENNSADPKVDDNNLFTVQLSPASSGPYTINLGEIAPKEIVGFTGSGQTLIAGPFDLTPMVDDGPFPIKITDKYCQEKYLKVWRRHCEDAMLSSFEPAKVLQNPSQSGAGDGAIELTNLPSGYTALWYGGTLRDRYEGVHPQNIGKGIYNLILKNTATGCTGGPYTLELGDGPRLYLEAGLLGGCTLAAQLTYKDESGSTVSMIPVQPMSYRWSNPLNNETLSLESDYLVNSRPLWGLPTWVRIEAMDGTGQKVSAVVVVPTDCYPTCYPNDPSCCPNPNNPACKECEDEPCNERLLISYTARPAKCGQPSVVELIVSGGVNNNYYTTNDYNTEQGLNIQGLSIGWHVVKVYDRTSGLSNQIRVYVPDTPKPGFSVLNAINPSLGENNTFTIRTSGDAGPYSITFEGFAPYNRLVLAENGSLGTYSLPEGRGNGPFYVDIKDSYCNDTVLKVYRRRISCPELVSRQEYVPIWDVKHPEGKYTFDGSIELLNLPPSMVAEWSGGAISNTRQGALLNNIPNGTYFLVVKNPTNDCIVYESGPIILRLPTIILNVTSTNCELTAQALRFDGDGMPMSSSGLQYRWVNLATGEPIAFQKTIDLSLLQLSGNPDKLVVYAFDNADNRISQEYLIPDECGIPVLCSASLNYTITNPTCLNPQGGSIRVLPNSNNYITWISPAKVVQNPFDWNQSNLTAGEYKVQVHTESCKKTFTISLKDPIPIKVSYEEISGTGINIIVTDGIEPYSYKWSDQNASISQALRTGLEAGEHYTVVVKDSRGCQDTIPLIYDPCAVSKPNPYALYVEHENKVTIIPNGGVPGYKYNWTRQGAAMNNQFGATKYDLLKATYTITVTDTLGCVGVVEYQHPGCGELLSSLSVQDRQATTCNTCDGEAWVTLDGISNYDDYVVLWNQINVVELLNNSTGLRAEQLGSTLHIYNVCSGSHEVLVSRIGVNACAISRRFEVGASNPCNEVICENSDLAVEQINEFLVLDKSCASDTIDIDLRVYGGKMPYTHQWTYKAKGSSEIFKYNSSLASFGNAQPGEYKYTVLDANGCDVSQTYVVIGPENALKTSEVVVQPACTGGAGQITVEVTGGGASPQIVWEDNVNAGFIRSNINIAGIYHYTVSDETGCKVPGMAEVTSVQWRPAFDRDTLSMCPNTGLNLEAYYLPRYNVEWSSPIEEIVIENPTSDRLDVEVAGVYILTRTHKTLSELCPAQKDTIVVIYGENCRSSRQTCKTYEYQLPEIEPLDVCMISKTFAADADALRRHKEYVEALRRNFTNSYVSSVMGSMKETLVVSYTDLEQHYTLYYYDQAGNLVRTVPPAGVRALSKDHTKSIEKYWTSVGTEESTTTIPSIHTEHTLATTYAYNSLNQLISQDMPDHEAQDLWEYQKTQVLPDTMKVSTLDVSGQKVWAFANGNTETQLYRSNNGGKDFIPGLNLNPGRILDMIQTETNNYFAVGTQGLVLRALNGAGIWELMPFPVRADLRKAHFIDKNKGYVLSTAGQLWRTIDGGQNWTTVTTSVTWLSTSMGNLSQTLADKVISDIHIYAGRMYIGANEQDNGYLFESQDLANMPVSISFKRMPVKGVVMNKIILNGDNMEIIAGRDIFQQTSSTEMKWVRRHNIGESYIANWESNGQVHLVKTSNNLYVSTDGSNFTVVNGITGGDIQIRKINGRIVVWMGTRIWRLENTGALTELMPGNNDQILSYYYDGTHEFVAYGNANVKNINTGDIYALSAHGIYYFNTFVVVDDLLLVCNGSQLFPLKLTTTGNPAVPHIVSGTTLSGNYKEVRKIGQGYYVIGNDNRSIYALSNLNGSIPSVSVSNNPIHQLINSNVYDQRFTFRNSPDSYMYISGDQSELVTSVSGGVATSIQIHTGGGKVKSLTSENNNRLYAFLDNGNFYSMSGNESELSFRSTGFTQEIIASANGSNNTIRIGATNGRVYRMASSNDIFSFSEEDNTFLTGSNIIQMSGDYLLTTAGYVNRYNGTNWILESGLHIPGFGVLNSTSGAVLSGGNNARILYKTGNYWSEVAPLKVGRIYDVSVGTDGSHLLAVGDKGTLLESEDAGENFRPLQGPTSGKLTSISHYASNYVIGDDGGNIYLRTSSGYTTATVSGNSQSPGQPIVQIYNDGDHLWAIRGREVLRSSNGSNFTVALTASKPLKKIFLNNSYGFIVGDGGTAYRIVPEGVTEAGSSGMSLSTISIGGDLEAMLLPTDAGLNDDKGTGIPISDLRSVHFQDKLTGFITGVEGIALKTTDGGYHWHKEGVYTQDANENPLIILPEGEHGVYSDIQSLGIFRDRTHQLSSRFWYDQLGRLVLSQNSRQFAIESYLDKEDQYKDLALPTGDDRPIRAYSYTLYDKIGRITEVGELLSREELEVHKHESQVQYSFMQNTFVPNAVRVQITQTYYDRTAFSKSESGLVQDNLRPRVASVTYQDRMQGSFDRATHYSYDVHGNVESLVQHIREGDRDLRKRIDYDYDLISGKVNRVVYQPGELDQFIHRYGYDGDNRITEVHTSHDGIVWTKEANYEYYAHGPLARIVFGEQNIETQDFTYTLQGWIKALNGQHFRYALGYFAGDYSSIGTTNNLATPIADNLDLYNGNIATMASLNPKLSEETWTRQFTYDQLNRITGSKSIGMTHTDAYKTSYTYDANGNIMSLNRFNEAGLAFDSLKYQYQNKKNGYKHNTNKLRWVDDSPALSANHGEDLEDQDVDNYHYDEIGNLTSDEQEGIARIEWNIYGKVSHIIRTEASTDSNLEFLYDATGNRVAKIIKPKNANPTITYYIRDATGNVLSVYKKSESSYTPELAEQYIYGSSRIGILGMGNIDNSRTLGLRSYELTDHLGNVRVVLNDAKNSVGLTSVTAAYDYYPFGMMMPGRKVDNGYRYGFNGKEMDNEVKGNGNSYDFGARIYDPRLGRFLSLDPHARNYPSLSDYAFVGNMPIWAIDPDGRDIVVLSDPKGAGGAGHQAVLISDGKGGWNYVSKDGSAGNNPAYGKPIIIVQNFKTIEEFAASEHNFVKNDDGTFKTDEDGNKIQRYEEGYLIKTDPSTDPASFEAAKSSASCTYILGSADCSHVAKDALDKAKTPEGEQVENGEYGDPIIVVPKTKYTKERTTPNPNFNPNTKQESIEKKNKGTDVDKKLEPKS
jgi:RHS repeat-associated protein